MKNAVFFILVLFFSAGCATQDNQMPAKVISDGKWEITIDSVSLQDELLSEKVSNVFKAYEPKPGNQFAIVNLSIENISPSKEKYLYRQFNELSDESGNRYKVDFEHQLLLLESNTGFVEVYGLKSGGKRSGSIVFQIPSDSSQLKFHYNNTFTNQEYNIELEPFISRENKELIKTTDISGESKNNNNLQNTITDSGLKIKINNVNFESKIEFTDDYFGKSIYKPTNGNVFLLIDLSVENVSEAMQGYGYILSDRIKDGSGIEYVADFENQLVLMSKGEGLDSSINLQPGEQSTGKVVYQVPKNESKFEYLFQNVFTDEKYSIELDAFLN